MTYFDSTNSCCGVAELHDITNLGKESIKRLLTETFVFKINTQGGSWGMLIGYFVKSSGAKKFEGHKTMELLVKAGAVKLPKFINPNSGNTIQPIYIIAKNWNKKNWKAKLWKPLKKDKKKAEKLARKDFWRLSFEERDWLDTYYLNLENNNRPKFAYN
ncbi:MAG: hypothetical protein ACREBU_03550 [Nitrososphaera sp.]